MGLNVHSVVLRNLKPSTPPKRRQSGRKAMLTTHPHLMQKLIMHEAYFQISIWD
jgi:hypothetical protein